LIELLKSLNIGVEIVDERFEGNPLTITFRGVLREEQQQAAEKLLHFDTGVLAASTAFGKTIVAIYVLACRGVNTLVIVHRRQLLDQWVASLSSFLDLDPSQIGQIGGGKRKPSGLIDVAMIQSLNNQGIVDDIVGHYGQVIVDECHHISASSFEAVVHQCKARYILGLSATVTRKDGHHPIIFMQCGPARYRVDDRKQAQSRPFLHKVITRKTSFQLPSSFHEKPGLILQEVYATLVADETRNQMIVSDVVDAIRAGRSPVLLTERRGHVELLAHLLSSQVHNIIVMSGGMGKKQRQLLAEKLASIQEDDERLIIATGRYLGEGFDDARLDTLFLALPISWHGTLAQYAGRLHRLHHAKREVMIYDYIDTDVQVLAKMFEKRRRGYRALGYEVDDKR
jgi:superfamily II DNA or RNA helicase